MSGKPRTVEDLVTCSDEEFRAAGGVVGGTSWRGELTEAMAEHGETWADVVATTLSEEDMDRAFDSGFGSKEGVPFMLWTARRVYFPVEYDGAESVESAPRDPCDEAMEHVG